MRNTKLIRKPAILAAVLVVCLSLSVTALASTGVLQGFFRDISDWRGAVVGTAYEQATDEIHVTATANGEELTVLAIFVSPQAFPYREAEKLGIAAYSIVDAGGRTVQEGTGAAAEIVNGQAAISIRLENLPCGTYKLMISAFVSEKKADQPLTLSGSWESVFSKE